MHIERLIALCREYGLDNLADELDREVTAALAAQFGLTYRNLLKRKPAERLARATEEL